MILLPSLIRPGLAALLVLLPLPQPSGSGSRLVDCLAARPTARWRLAPSLREISGLVVTENGRLLAHDDELARVVELDPKNGRILKEFRLGRSLVPGDFEAIALAGTRLFLVTSSGTLFETREGRNGEAVPFTVTQTGAGTICEIEGMSWDPAAGALLFLCKTARRKAVRGSLTVLRWSVERKQWLTPDRLSMPLSSGFRAAFGAEFRGSDLSRDPVTGHYLAIGSINRAVIEFTSDGRILGEGPLGKHHPQAEGVAINKEGSVFVSDEGGKSAGTIAVYDCGR